MEKRKSFFREVSEFLLIIVFIVIPFRLFVAEPYIVSGASMSPTLETGHYLIINKFGHKMYGMERGDIVVFKYPNDPSKFFIKRIIGLPGEEVKIEDKKVFIKKESESSYTELDEPYIKNSQMFDALSFLADDEYFVMGDNRGSSSDSRSWGPLNIKYVKGEPVLRLYPFTSINFMPGAFEFE